MAHYGSKAYSLFRWNHISVFERPFVKRFALCYQTVFCLSSVLTLVYCGQSVRWLKNKLGTEVGLGPGHSVLDGDPAPSPKKGNNPQFSVHVCCGQMAGWMKVTLGTEVDLGPGRIVLDRDPAPPAKWAQQPALFGPCLLWPRIPISATAELLFYSSWQRLTILYNPCQMHVPNWSSLFWQPMPSKMQNLLENFCTK